MAKRGRVTKAVIIEKAQGIIARHGMDGLTFQALADLLGVSKQAIIYWYPNKWELGRDLVVAALKAEAEATGAALAGAASARDAVERFLRALIDFHLADLQRFRSIYVTYQMARQSADPAGMEASLAMVHEATSAMYAALEEAIAADPRFHGQEHPRRMAVAIHMSGVGLLTMVAMAEFLGDPLAHDTNVLVDTLVALVGRSSQGG